MFLCLDKFSFECSNLTSFNGNRFHFFIVLHVQVSTNFKFCFFFKSIATTNPSCCNAKLNSPNATKFILSPNVILGLIESIFMSSASQKGKEKVCEEIVACPFKDPIKFTINEPKKKKIKTSKWEINRAYQNKWVLRFIWYELVCEGNGKMKMVRCKFAPTLKGEINC